MELQTLRGSPYSAAIEFAWPLPQEDWAEWLPDIRVTNAEDVRLAHTQRLGSALLELVKPTIEEGETAEIRPIGFGRGFSVEGIVLIVVGAFNVIANLDGVISFCLRVRDWYRKLNGAELSSGRRLQLPTISLGAAVALAGADLSERVGDVNGIRVVSAVVHPGAEIDHSGSDLFTVVFGNAERSWIYLVDAEGRVLLFAEGLPLPSWGPVYWGAGGGIDDASYPTLAGPVELSAGDRSDEEE